MRKMLMMTVALACTMAAGDAFATPVTVDLEVPTFSGAAFVYSAPVVTVPGASMALVFSSLGQSIQETLMNFTASTTGGMYTKSGTITLSLFDAPGAPIAQMLGLEVQENSAIHHLSLTPGQGSATWTFGSTAIGVQYSVVSTGNWDQKALIGTYTLVSEAGGDPTPVNEPASIALLGFGLVGLGMVRHVARRDASHG
jgi:hypothetical protein